MDLAKNVPVVDAAKPLDGITFDTPAVLKLTDGQVNMFSAEIWLHVCFFFGFDLSGKHVMKVSKSMI